MQNKNNKPNADRKKQKVTKVMAPIIKSRILFTQHSQYSENTKVSSSHNLVVPFVEGNEGKMFRDTLIGEKVEGWHKLMIQTFEKFLLQLDELFMNLRTEERFKRFYCLPIIKSYKDICEKLRLEILIAIDKLELVNKKGERSERDIEFLNKMNQLKSQLLQVRWQYHQAIQEWNSPNKQI